MAGKEVGRRKKKEENKKEREKLIRENAKLEIKWLEAKP